ncbi:glycosyltransferase family 4 protein [Thiohalophilus thiocyanatoxydans]|uniref:Glycosyltransferase involved in cell wall biosynthesis n=1 Tax=Thiohalophilus thiocyanatoxydans TaxID=381308 RepID=A0A4R8IP51_9GAMM|nr:glycosyltransferase family 4 protein [Thiohalophilus thiocyanatoxydans]TDY02692.1 glycosyltransferase involved in cell wall biosynthesis [Thiohalophilus thiocyanatoxydans]
MRHILIVNHNAGSVHHGPNFRSYYVARSLLEHGFRVTIVCSGFSHKLTKLPVIEGESHVEDVDGVRMIWLKMPVYRSSVQRLWNYAQFAMRLRRLDAIVPEPVDAVVCSSPPPYWIWACRHFTQQREIPLIFECRDLWPDVILETRRTAILNPAVWLMMLAERIAYRSADAVVAVNQEARKTMERRGLAKGKFHAIPNGVSLEADNAHESLSSSIRERLPSDDVFRVGYAGSLSRVYGLEYLLGAARLLCGQRVHFVLAGSGGDEQWLREQATGLDNVTFVGWIPKPQLHAFLSVVDVAYAGLLDIPSFAIGSDSTKVFEYLKAARPVVHALGAENSVIAEAGAGLHVPPENSEAIAKAVVKMRDLTQDKRDALGRAGLDYLKQYRTYEALGFQWKELLDSWGN